MDHGLKKRAPSQCDTFLAAQAAAAREETSSKSARDREVSDQLRDSEGATRLAVQQGLQDALTIRFPYVHILQFIHHADQGNICSGLDFGSSDKEKAEDNRRESHFTMKSTELTYICR
jgi:hypothetical protein